MIQQWLRDNAVSTAQNLSAITRKTAGDGAISGYGMQNKVRRLIDLLRCAMYPNIYHDARNIFHRKLSKFNQRRYHKRSNSRY